MDAQVEWDNEHPTGICIKEIGFDRTREISTKSAREISEAAKTWGQTDDITVVTVRRTKG